MGFYGGIKPRYNREETDGERDWKGVPHARKPVFFLLINIP